MSTQLASQTTQSLRIAYQPFLSTSRAQHLLSRLSSLPHTFLPVPNTSLQFPPSAQIILLSRGGRPFAPVHQQITRTTFISARARDWSASGAKYYKLLERWDIINARLPILITKLRNHFSDQIIQKQEFDKIFRVLVYSGDIQDPSAVRAVINEYNSLRKEQLRIHPLLAKTHAAMKVNAHRSFGFERQRLKEYMMEDHRDMLDLFRLQLEKRFKGMGLVRFPDIAEPKPWILLPEDPEGAWGDDFPYHVSNLIDLANERFLMSPEEQEEVLEREAQEYIHENIHQLLRVTTEGLTREELLECVKNKLREDKKQLWMEDSRQMTLPGLVGRFEGEMWREPKTTEDQALLEVVDRKLVKRGAWRVAD